MPKKYRVTKDGVTVEQKVGERTNRNTGHTVELLKSNVYNEGDILSEEQIAPSQLQALENGDEPISNLLEEVKKTESKPAKKSATKKRTTTTKESE
jgi:hypothetical protein